jgi:CRISPR/Cas system-associated protein Cas10 (large subunit of type III CRISPR-Cas system)
MASTRIEHEFDCTEATFWQLTFFDQEFNRRLYLESLKFPVWKVVEEKITDDTLERRVEVQPLVENVPGPVKKLLGDRFGYVEEGKLDRKQNRYRFRVIPSAMPDKTQISGEMRTERLGDTRIRRVVEFSVEIKVMMLGKIVEQKTIEDTRASYEKMAVFFRQYLKEKAGS